MITRIDLPDLNATAAFGRRLGQRLFPGAVVGLIGPLGAGKTHLTQAIAAGLDVIPGQTVCSPTFGLIHEYAARLPIYHFDVYRLKSPIEFLDLGAGEYLDGDGVCIIEWADRILDLLPDHWLEIRIEITGPTSRALTCISHGEMYEAMVGG